MTTTPTLWQRARSRFRQTPKRWRWLSVAVVLAVLSSLFGLNPYWRPLYFGSKSMQAPTEYQWQCLGRYQMLVPKGLQAHTQGTDRWYRMFTLFYGMDADHKQVEGQVRNDDYTPEAFDRSYRAHRDELARTINSRTGKPMLLQEEHIGAKSFLLRRMSADYTDIGVFTELHQLAGARYVILKAKSFPRDVDAAPYLSTVNFTNAEDRLKSISSKLFAHTNANASRPGFCFGGVVFDVGQDTEQADFDFRWVDTPEQPIVLEVFYQGVQDAGTREPFSARIPNLPLETRLKMHTLRNRTTKVGPGLPWHELLTRQHAWQVASGTQPEPVHVFLGQHAHTQGTTLDKPDFELRLILGEGQDPPVASPLSDADALARWDRIVQSIRPR